jgi:iron complex outermembrane receptor protein
VSFSHLHKYNKWDLVAGGNFVREESHLQGEHSNRGRISWKTRFHPQNDRITYGVNGNFMLDDEGLYFLWQDADTGSYLPFGGAPDLSTSTVLNWKYAWLTLDPWLNFFDKYNNGHYFKMRFYNNHVSYSDSTGGNAYLINFDYKFHREFENEYVITAGVTGYNFHVKDDQLDNHDGVFAGAYFQLDKELFGRLHVNIGAREEFYKLDSLDGVGVPVFKAGMNYQAGRLTFIRASFGQGYRFPSLVEKYAETNVGILTILPNPDLKAEYGWNAELGIKRSIVVDDWLGYADMAIYLTEYFEMTEFNPVSFVGGINFQSQNNTRACIGGVEFTLNGNGELFGNKFSCTAGYNYVYPADLQADSANQKFSSFVDNFFEGITAKSDDTAFLASVLKYRFRHMLRVDLQYEVKRFSFGTDIGYFSLMENLDPIYLIFIPGINEYREEHLDGDWVFDARIGYDLTQSSRLQFMVKNITNRMYALRPAKFDPPRNFTLQYNIEF